MRLDPPERTLVHVWATPASHVKPHTSAPVRIIYEARPNGLLFDVIDGVFTPHNLLICSHVYAEMKRHAYQYTLSALLHESVLSNTDL